MPPWPGVCRGRLDLAAWHATPCTLAAELDPYRIHGGGRRIRPKGPRISSLSAPRPTKLGAQGQRKRWRGGKGKRERKRCYGVAFLGAIAGRHRRKPVAMAARGARRPTGVEMEVGSRPRVALYGERPWSRIRTEDSPELPVPASRSLVGGDGGVGKHQKGLANSEEAMAQPEVARGSVATHTRRRRRRRPVVVALRRSSTSAEERQL